MMAARSTPATILTPTATDESAGAAAELADRIRVAVAAVTDPEYPDLTIADLGILEGVTVLAPAPGEVGPSVLVELVPTVLGCPALRTIELDVVAAALAPLPANVGKSLALTAMPSRPFRSTKPPWIEQGPQRY